MYVKEVKWMFMECCNILFSIAPAQRTSSAAPLSSARRQRCTLLVT
jgi:hypothetical protein